MPNNVWEYESRLEPPSPLQPLPFTLHVVYIACSISYMVMPVYISETSPKEHRGMLASIIGPTYSFGLLVSLSMNVGFSKFHLGWRVPFMIIALLGLICAVGMLFVPHTPR